MDIKKMSRHFGRRTFLGEFPRQIWTLRASASRWDLEEWILGFRKCASAHFRLLSVTLKVIGEFSDGGMFSGLRCQLR